MKFQIATFLITLAFISCSKKEQPGNLHITGNIKGLKKGTLYIQKMKDTLLVAIDTIQVDGNAEFTSDLTIESPEMYYLFLDRGVTNSLDNNLPFFAEAGNIRIDTSLEFFLSDATITGSKNHEKYEEYRKVVARFNDRNLALTESKFYAFKYNNTKKMDSLEAAQDIITKKRYLYTTNFALNNRDFEIAPFITLSEIPDISLKYLDTIQKTMSPKVAQSLYGKKLMKFYNERKLAGK